MRALFLASASCIAFASGAFAQACSGPALPSSGTQSQIVGASPQATLGQPLAATPVSSYSSSLSDLSSGSPYLTAMLNQPWGGSAASTAQQLGVNPNSLASIFQIESGMQNIPTENGSSSATGPGQLVQGTFNGFNQQYGLGYSPTDITNPAANATVASYVLRDYASAVTNATGSPATTAQAYGAYLFGPTAGAALANANLSDSLSSYVSAKALANNGMSGLTVGQFYSAVSARLGAAAKQPVLTGSPQPVVGV